MEVHNPHHPTHKKKWTEYLLEFLMLFLAVFLGFIAENIRENQVEKKIEKEYMSSLVQDIKKDIAQMDTIQISNLASQRLCDSLKTLLTGKAIISNSNHAFKLWNAINGFVDFVPNDGTIEQLKSSGGLRLIKKKNIVDKLMDYYKVVDLIKIHQSSMNSFLFQQTNMPELFDVPRLAILTGKAPVPLLDHDEKQISKAYLHTWQWGGLLNVLSNGYFKSAKAKGEKLLNAINTEYRLQNE